MNPTENQSVLSRREFFGLILKTTTAGMLIGCQPISPNHPEAIVLTQIYESDMNGLHTKAIFSQRAATEEEMTDIPNGFNWVFVSIRGQYTDKYNSATGRGLGYLTASFPQDDIGPGDYANANGAVIFNSGDSIESVRLLIPATTESRSFELTSSRTQSSDMVLDDGIVIKADPTVFEQPFSPGLSGTTTTIDIEVWDN